MGSVLDNPIQTELQPTDEALANEIFKGPAPWVKFLSEHQLGVLAGTVKQLNHITLDDKSHVGQLANAILKDPNLTSRILRISNSAMYKGQGSQITTISRAIVVLGFQTIRDMALSLKLMDNLLGRNPDQQIMEAVALSYHSAMQAKNLVFNCKPVEQEEVFVASLLSHVGETAFLSSGHCQVSDYMERIDAGMAKEKAADIVLGCTFDRLTMALSRAWSLGDMVSEAIEKGIRSGNPLVQAVRLGDMISRASLIGWESEEFDLVLRNVAKYTGKSTKECMGEISRCCEMTRKQATTFGVEQVQHLIPTPVSQTIISQTADEKISAVKKAKKPTKQMVRGNAELQQQILTEIHHMMEDKIDISLVFQMVLEGMHRGIGLDRVALALLNGKKEKLVVKAALCKTEDRSWLQGVATNVTQDNVFAYALKYGDPLWMGCRETASLQYLVHKSIEKIIKPGPFFVAPILSNKRRIGILYGDNHISNAELTKEDFQSFGVFVRQANACLEKLTTPAK